jgi:hypothetical protein
MDKFLRALDAEVRIDSDGRTSCTHQSDICLKILMNARRFNIVDGGKLFLHGKGQCPIAFYLEYSKSLDPILSEIFIYIHFEFWTARFRH